MEFGKIFNRVRGGLSTGFSSLMKKIRRESDSAEATEETTAHDTRGKVESAFTFGNDFNLNREIRNQNISEKAGEFLRQCPPAEDMLKRQYEEALKGFYEFDAYTYIHTVQMLNCAAAMSDSEIYVLANAAEMDGVIPEDFRNLLLGAIVFHDKGKMNVPIELLNAGRLSSKEFREVKKHAIGSVDIVVEKIVALVDPRMRIKELIEANRTFRESNNEAVYLLDEIDKLIRLQKRKVRKV